MIELSVCIGSSCHIKGSYNVIQTFLQLIEQYGLHDKIDFRSTFCLKQCQNFGIGLILNGEAYRILPESAEEFFTATVMQKVLQ